MPGNGAERFIFTRYCALHRTRGFDTPALIPQVYLHYDPYTRRASMPLTWQRMDFLLLLPHRRIHRRRLGPTWRGAASVVAPGTAVGCAHVPRPGRAIGEPVAQVHGALRTGDRRFEQRDVGGHRAVVEHLLPDAEHDRVHPEVETVEELLAQQGLHQVQAPDDFHVLVPVPDLAHRAGQIRAELGGPGPRELGPAAGGHVLRDAVEQRGDLVVRAALLVGPVSGEDVIGPPAEQEGVGALVRGTDLRPGDLVQQGRLPAAEREPRRVLVGAAGRLPDEVEGCEQLDVDEAHALLPMSWLSRSGGRPVGAGRLIAATAPSLVLAGRLARCMVTSRPAVSVLATPGRYAVRLDPGPHAVG